MTLHTVELKFPINRRHQGLATSKCMENDSVRSKLFPINRRHQGLATRSQSKPDRCSAKRFQSIGVTKDWRLIEFSAFYGIAPLSFQSIGVTKDWRR